jgi:hypothetical protein
MGDVPTGKKIDNLAPIARGDPIKIFRKKE